MVLVDYQGTRPQIPTILYEWFYSQFIATRHETVEQNLISDFKTITKLWWIVGGGQAFKITALLLVRANTTKSILKTKATIVSWGDTWECWRHNSRQVICIHKAGMLVFLQQNCSFKSISFSNGLISSFEADSDYFSATSAVPGRGFVYFFYLFFFQVMSCLCVEQYAYCSVQPGLLLLNNASFDGSKLYLSKIK